MRERRSPQLTKRGRPRPLTNKAMRFALAVAEHTYDTYVAAYRATYGATPRMKAHTAEVNASKLMADPRVQAVVQSVRERAINRSAVTQKRLTDELLSIAETHKQRRPGVAVTAILGVARMHGYMISKVEDITRRPAGRLYINGVPVIEVEIAEDADTEPDVST